MAPVMAGINELRIAAARGANGSALLSEHSLTPIPLANGAQPQLHHNGEPLPFPENVHALQHATHATLDAIITVYNLPAMAGATQPAKVAAVSAYLGLRSRLVV
jgi:hypothetical protein